MSPEKRVERTVTVVQIHEPAPIVSDVESDSGDSDLGAVGKWPGDDSTTLSGERRPRMRRVRVAHRWLDPHRDLENDWKRRGRQIQLLLDIDARLPNGNLIALKIWLTLEPKKPDKDKTSGSSIFQER